MRVASSGQEVLNMLADDDFRPDAFLLDVMMPTMDGPALLAALRENQHHRHTPVIFVTARTQSREISAFNALDIVGVITKPFDPLTLAAEVRDILKRAAV